MRVWMPVRVVPSHGVGGGMERVAWAVGTGLAGRGHQVRLVTTADAGGVVDESVGSGLRVHHVPETTWRRYQGRWWSASYDLLQREHAAEPYDVILSQSAGALGYLGAARTHLGIPCAVLLHGSAQSEVRTSWRGARNPRGLYRLARLGYRLPRQVAAWRRAVPAVDSWLAVSAHVASATERELGLPAGRVKIVPVGVDTERFRPDPDARAALRARLGIAVEAPVLVLATRLQREKGVDVALRAARQLLARHADLRVLVAGAGHDEGRLRRQAAHLQLEGVCTFLGPVDHDRLPAVMAGGDIFLLPSRCDEGRPVSLVEAGAAGLPVVASRSEGIAGVVAHGTTGLLVPRGDADALAGAVLRLLDDDGMRRSMGERARQQAVSHWRAAAMVEVVERALAGLMTHEAEGLHQ